MRASSHPGAAGYIIGRDAAAMLLSQTEVLSRPIDHILFEDLLLEEQFKIYQLIPALCIQEQLNGAPGLQRRLRSGPFQELPLRLARPAGFKAPVAARPRVR
ncbi:MAG: hypothetical protein ACLP7P_05835 [Rhodomicrobium sp.]